METVTKTTTCQNCGLEFNYQWRQGPSPRTCQECQRKKRATYYAGWYAKNGRTRSGGYSIKIMEWRRQNPEKAAAHKMVAAARKGGAIINPGQCSACGKISNYLDAHHDDYTTPLHVRWLCISCHRNAHGSR